VVNWRGRKASVWIHREMNGGRKRKGEERYLYVGIVRQKKTRRKKGRNIWRILYSIVFSNDIYLTTFIQFYYI